MKGRITLVMASITLSLAGCTSADADYDGIQNGQDCDPSNGHADKSDMDIGCGCDGAVAKHGCAAEVNNPPSSTDGGTAQEGEQRVCGAVRDGKLLNAGICRVGLQSFRDGGWSDCENAVMPQTETCNGADDDCNGQTDEIFDLGSDVGNCGVCGRVCSFAHAPASCVAGVCTMGDVDPFYYDLNGSATDGAEYGPCIKHGAEVCNGVDDDCDGTTDEGFYPQVNPLNCGQCGNICALPHVATQSCAAGVCVVASGACETGWVNTNSLAFDGCEAPVP